MAYSHYSAKKRSLNHLTPFERGQMMALCKEGKTLQEIFNAIGKHKSTISRELQRSTVTQHRSDFMEYHKCILPK